MRRVMRRTISSELLIATLWWRCVQYFVIASCGYMSRDNSCIYACMFVFMSVAGGCDGVCGNVCCVVAVIENSVF